MKTSELREISTGKQPYATLESDLAAEVIRLREALAVAAETLAKAKFAETAKALRSLLAEHDE